MDADVYARSAWDILRAGYSPIPLDPATKDQGIPVGVTGYAGRMANGPDVAVWVEDFPRHNVAARLPREVVSIDVDNYGGKSAAETLARLEAELGTLPATWRVSSRFDSDYDGLSGCRLFRLPPEYAAKADDRGAGWRTGWPGIDVLRFAHRFVVAPPSIHPRRGTAYRVLDESTGEVGDAMPAVADLPVLPLSWCAALLHGDGQRERKDTASSVWWSEGRPCPSVQGALGKSLAEMEQGRHDGVGEGMMRLTRLGEQGHEGVRAAIDTLRGAFILAATRPGDGQRTQAKAEAEWSRWAAGVDARIGEQLTPEADRGCRHGSTRTELPPFEVKPDAAKSEGEATAPPRSMRLRPASGFRIVPTLWVWEDRLPAGALALLAGREGLGKSLVWAWIAATMTRGDLPGVHDGTPRDVVVVVGEDSIERTVAPRLRAAGADLERVHFADVITDTGGVDMPVLPVDVGLLREAVDRVGAGLVVLDPLVSVIAGNLDTHRDNETRRALEPLARLADETGASVLGLVHLNKSSGGDVGDRVIGSRAFVATARSVLTVAKSQEDDGARLLSVTKSNLGLSEPDLAALVFRVVTRPVEDADGVRLDPPAVEWGGETTERVSDALAAGNLDTGERDERDAMAAEIRRIIIDAGGEAAAQDVTREMRQAFGEVGKSALNRARDRAGVRTRKGGMQAGWVWFLAEGSAEGSEGSTRGNPGTFGPFVEPSTGEATGMGPCALCSQPTRRYGAEASGPVCESCRAA